MLRPREAQQWCSRLKISGEPPPDVPDDAWLKDGDDTDEDDRWALGILFGRLMFGGLRTIYMFTIPFLGRPYCIFRIINVNCTWIQI